MAITTKSIPQGTKISRMGNKRAVPKKSGGRKKGTRGKKY